MTPDFLPLPVVRFALRANLPYIGVASVVLVAGLASLFLATARSRDRLLLWLGILSTLYGIRLFVQNDLLKTALGASDQTVLICSLCLSYVIGIPYALFARELLGEGWRRSIALWLWCEIAFALIAIPTLLWTRQHHVTDLINAFLIVNGTILLRLQFILIRGAVKTSTRGLTWPLLIFGTFVLLNNFGFRLAGMDVEPFGFLILLCGLGFTASRYALARERKLVEVEQELTLARRIQNSLIPEFPPQLSGLLLATRYQPMTSVAGDFFDFLQTSDTALTVLVADVSGHGVPAALVASMLKVCFAAQREQAHDPAKILAGLNEMLRGSLGGQYVTAACAAIDLSSSQVTYAGAGHPPSLLIRTNTGEVIQLAENGLFLGPFAQATYANVTASFAHGDKLLLYTDGILEATGADGKEFGLARLEQLLRETQNATPAEVIAELFRRISTPTQQDDLTAVLLQPGYDSPMGVVGSAPGVVEKTKPSAGSGALS